MNYDDYNDKHKEYILVFCKQETTSSKTRKDDNDNDNDTSNASGNKYQ